MFSLSNVLVMNAMLDQAVKDVVREAIVVNEVPCFGDMILATLRQLSQELVSRCSAPEQPHPGDMGGVREPFNVEADLGGCCSGSFPSSAALPRRNDRHSATSAEARVEQQLLRHILLACSRTAAAGDALVLAAEMYGGEGLVMCPVAGPARCSSLSQGSTAVSFNPRGLTVDVFTDFNLFLKEDLEEDMESARPLIGVHTQVTTSLVLWRSIAAPAATNQRTPRERLAQLLLRLFLYPEKVLRRELLLEPYAVL